MKIVQIVHYTAFFQSNCPLCISLWKSCCPLVLWHPVILGKESSINPVMISTCSSWDGCWYACDESLPGLHRYVTEPLTGSIMTISDLDTHWKCTTLAIKLTLRTKITLSDVTMICSFTAISLIAGSLKRHFHVMRYCPLDYTISSIWILI